MIGSAKSRSYDILVSLAFTKWPLNIAALYRDYASPVDNIEKNDSVPLFYLQTTLS